MIRSMFGWEQDMKDAMEKQSKFFSGKDPLVELNATVDWDIFSPDLRRFRKSLRANDTGRKPYDPLLMFKILILQSLYNLPDETLEFMIHDRISFMRFLGLSATDAIPDARTIWRFRNELAKADMVERLFSRFNEHLNALGLLTNPGQIIDATIVSVPRQHITKSEREEIASGSTPDNWSAVKSRQKDTDATWTQKGGKSYFGYKNHTCVDVENKLIRKYSATTASIHDSQVFEEILDVPTATTQDLSAPCAEGKAEPQVYADKAYASQANEEILKKHGMKSRILHRAARGRKLTEEERAGNRENSRVRCRVEHVFGMQRKMIGNMVVRAVCYARVRCVLGLRNLCYNLKRFVYLTKKGVVCPS